MTSILVAGGTGQVGRRVVAESVRRGFDTRALSRHLPGPSAPGYIRGAGYFQADVLSAIGLAEALDGVDVVVDCLDSSFRAAARNLPNGARRLTAAAELAGVSRLVLLSIVNVDQSNFGYYRAKTGQERVYRQSALETVIVRATQFHSLVALIFDAGAKVRILPTIMGASFQSIAIDDVAAALLDSATAQDVPDVGMRTIGGPQVQTMRLQAHLYRQVTGVNAVIVPIPVPGRFGKFLRAGGNLAPDQQVGQQGFAQWLLERKATSE